MADSKCVDKAAVSPFNLWSTAYDFLMANIKNWAFELFKFVLEKQELINFVAELSLLIINLITSGILVFKANSNLVMSIAGFGFFSNFYLTFEKLFTLFPNFNPRRAMEEFYISIIAYKDNIMEKVYANANDAENDWMEHAKTIMTAFFASIVGGLGYMFDGMKGISNAFRTLSFTKSGITSIKEIVDSTISDLVLGKVDPVEPERKEITRLVEVGQDFSRMSLGEIASSNQNRKDLRDYIKEVNAALGFYKSRDTSSLRSMLVGLMKELNKKLEEIDHLLPSRQVTSGVFIHGAKGVGKSSLVSYLSKQLAEKFSLQSKLYTVSTGVRFYEPYLNEDFGIVNEFGSTTKEESFVFDANRICSSDPFNFESATLNGKVGSCQLKMLFITSNNLKPEIPELQAHAIPAFWDRFIVIEAVDDLVKNRRQTYLHRKPDFSHLRFIVKEVSGNGTVPLKFDILFNNITITELLSILECKLAIETVKYNNSLKLEVSDEKQKLLSDLCAPFAGTYAYKYFGFQEVVKANTEGRNFCIMRIQGIEGTGKTCTARSLAQKWLRLTSRFNDSSIYTIQESTNFEQFLPISKPCVYILDDWVSLSMPNDIMHKYVEKMNATTQDSIFIITSNEVIKRTRFLDGVASRLYSMLANVEHHYPYNLKQYTNVYSGFFRRIGLDDFYQVGSNIHKVNSVEYAALITVENNGSYKHKRFNVGEIGMLEILKTKFINMQKDRFSLTILREKPDIEDLEVDMELVAETADVLFGKLRSAIGAASLYIKPTNKAYLKISDRILNGVTNLGRAVKPADFICDEIFSQDIPKEDRYITIVQRIVRVLLQYFHQPTFRIIIKDTNEVIYSKDSIVYYYNDNTEAYIHTEEDKVSISIGKPIVVTANEFASMLCMEKIENRFSNTNLTVAEYNALEGYYKRCISKNEMNTFIVSVAKREAQLLKYQQESYIKELTTARNNKLLVIGVAGLIGVTSLTAMYSLYKIVSNCFSHEEDIVTNAFANTGSTPPKRSEAEQSRSNKQALGVQITSNSEYTKKHSKVLINNDANTKINVNSPYNKKTSKVYIHANNNDHNNTPHEHICQYCGCLYSHIHRYSKETTHPQWRHQCPNEECSHFHRGRDEHQALLIQKLLYDEDNKRIVEPHTAFGLVELIGSAYTPAHSEFMRVFSKWSERKSRKLYDELQQARSLDIDIFKVLSSYEELRTILETKTIANMLSDEDLIECEETELERLHRQLQRCYARVNVGQRSAYCIHVGDGFFLTVSHCFKELKELCVVMSEGIRHPGVCVALLRNRDISVIYCKQLVNMASAKRYFVKDSDNLDMNGYFMRCGPAFEVLSGAVEYKAYQEQLDGRSDIEEYSPNTEVLKIRRVGMDCAKLIKRGDCGFPFICKVQGCMRVIGFHNAYKAATYVYGAFVSQPLIEDLTNVVMANSDELSTCIVVSIPIVDNYEVRTHATSMPFEYVNAIETAIKPDPFFPSAATNSMISLGYNSVFRNWGMLKEKHVTHDLQLKNENLTLPAAYNMAYVTDTTTLVQDGIGRPSPLWTQACKYELQENFWDEDIMSHAIELCYDYNKLTYGEKPFRILTEFEAINGTREPFLSNVDITTSAGPYARYFEKTFTKREIFDVKYTENSPIYSFNDRRVAQNIRNHLKTQTRLLEENFISPCLISQDNAKVENISRSKAEKGKVRLFNNVDPNINAILKRYFGDWFAHVMEKHSSGYYAVGQDPYITSTEIYHSFSMKRGKILNTDFSAFDKLLIPRLIRAFCEIGCRLTKPKQHHDKEWLYNVYQALYYTLTHAVHILDGSIYVVNNGNESGTFVTTLMNCVGVHIIFNYSFIRSWQKVPKFINILPSIRDVMARSEIRILGDDKTQKVSHEIPMTEQDLIAYAEELGMKCTPAKGDYHEEELIDFCSRVLYYDEKDQVVYPRLKKESINGLLYWFASFSVNQIRDNLMIALFEASFYERDYYEDILSDAMVVAKEMGVDIRTVPFTNYDQSRRRLRSFVMNDIECQKISALTDRETNENLTEDISKLIKRHILTESNIQKIEETGDSKEKQSERLPSKESRPVTQGIEGALLHEDKMASSAVNDNPISRTFELISKLKEPTPVERYEREGPEHSPTYTCTVEFKDNFFCGEGTSKTNAKVQCFGALERFLRDNIVANSNNALQVKTAEEAIQQTSIRAFSLYIEQHIKTAEEQADGKRFVTLVAFNTHKKGMENVNGFLCFYDNGTRYVLSPIVQSIGRKKAASCYLRYPGITMDATTREISLDTHESVPVWALRLEDAQSYSDDEHLVYANSKEQRPLHSKIRTGREDWLKRKDNYLHWTNHHNIEVGDYLNNNMSREYKQHFEDDCERDNYRLTKQINYQARLTAHNRAANMERTHKCRFILEDGKTVCKACDWIMANSGEEKPLIGVVNNDNPAVIPTSAFLASDKELPHPMIMNVSAPSNSWMSAGGIVHNIFDQVYNQFIWSSQFKINSTDSQGKIILQIPYTPVNNDYANSFIQNLLLLHSRFTGDWIVQFSCPGSASAMQGSLIFSWQPKRIDGDNAQMDQLTKYSYFTNSLATPWTQQIIMRDARQMGFYREVPRSSKKTDMDPNQPHIVVAVESPGVSAFKENNYCYLSIASKLCSEKDQMFNPSIKPFTMADPQNTVKYDNTKGYTLNF